MKFSKLVEPDTGTFRIFDQIDLRLSVPSIRWYGQEFEEPEAFGVRFSGWSKDSMDVEAAYILVGDATRDTTEPDTQDIGPENLPAIDLVLRTGLQALMTENGLTFLDWNGTKTDQVFGQNAIRSGYRVLDPASGEQERAAIRFQLRNRKIIIEASYLVNHQKWLSDPILGALKPVGIFDTSEHPGDWQSEHYLPGIPIAAGNGTENNPFVLAEAGASFRSQFVKNCHQLSRHILTFGGFDVEAFEGNRLVSKNGVELDVLSFRCLRGGETNQCQVWFRMPPQPH